MQKRQKKAFTLVELIVAVMILTILATVSFLFFKEHLGKSRDGKRLADMKTLESSIEIFGMQKNYPMPDNAVEIKVGSSVILYQWDIWENLTSMLWISDDMHDPLWDDYYTYAVDVKKKRFEVLTMLENVLEGKENTWFNIFPQSYALEDYSDRTPYTKGYKLGIILDEENTPIQKTGTGIDVLSVTDIYTAVLDTTDTITGTGKTIGQINPTASCKRILESGLAKGSKIYTINPSGTEFKVYCDMTTDSGGWTLVASYVNGSFFNDCTDVWMSHGTTCSTICPEFADASHEHKACDSDTEKAIQDSELLKLQDKYKITSSYGDIYNYKSNDFVSESYYLIPFTESMFSNDQKEYITYDFSQDYAQSLASMKDFYSTTDTSHLTVRVPHKTTNLDIAINPCNNLELAIMMADNDWWSVNYSIRKYWSYSAALSWPGWDSTNNAACHYDDNVASWWKKKLWSQNNEVSSYILWFIR